MSVNCNHFSVATLAAMVDDLSNKADELQESIALQGAQLKEERAEADYQRRMHQEWQDKYCKLENKYFTLKSSELGTTDVTWRKDVAHRILDKTQDLTNDQALVICGVVSDVLKHKIQAIKKWRSITGVGLKEAKDAVEAWHDRVVPGDWNA